MDSFDSILGGQTGDWVVPSWGAKGLPHHPIGMSCLLPLPAPGMGSEDRIAKQLCPDRYPPAVQSLQPWVLPLAGDRMENPTHWCQEKAGPLPGKLAMPS